MPPTAERYSPTFLATFLGCRQAAAWALRRRRGEDDAAPDGLDGHGELITRLGEEHEARVLEHLRATSEVAAIAGEDVLARTREAMDAGVPWVHQAALADGRWHGHADFLRRVERPCASWPWSYEPWDAKLARRAEPKHVLQIGVYAELLDAVQGGAPERMGLMLGGGEPDGDGVPGHASVEYRVADFRWYVRRVIERLLAFADALPGDFGGEPCPACGQCGWHRRCEALWESADHLSRVADLSREQRRRLVEANVATLGALADLEAVPPEDRPPVRLRVETLERLIGQAALQRRTARARAADAESGPGEDGVSAPPQWALLEHREGFGLDRLPPPDGGDLWFDFEGDPLEPGGLEYLCGVAARAGVEGPFGAADPVPGRPELAFRAFWAHDRAEERRSFEALVDALAEHFERHPGAHLYHYAPYENTAMKRLASSHGTREAEIDGMLRANRLVDLYRVVREGVRVGAESYSIKKLEPLYMDARATDTGDGGESVVMYHAWRATRDAALLADIEAYNRDDCVSTVLLHEWLLARSVELERVPAEAPDAQATTDESVEETDAERKKREAKERREAERAEVETEVVRLEIELGAGIEAGPGDDDAPGPATAAEVVDGREREARQLAADLLRFHQREDKPEWWAFFERLGTTPESLIDDADCLGGCTKDGTHWAVPEKRSHTYRFRFPAQETKLSRGSTAQLQGGGSGGEIVELDARAGTVTLKRGPSLGEPPERIALMPGSPIPTEAIAAAVRRVVRDYAGGGDAYEHVVSLLRGDPPRLRGRSSGEPIVPAEALEDPGATLAATIEAVRALDRSWLCIQGPPGAGKTYTLARVIDALVDDGLTVGVSSNSHAAIDNVLHGVERFRAGRVEREGVRPIGGLKKVNRKGDYASPLGDAAMVGEFTTSKKDDWHEGVDLFGGTAWWFSGANGPTVDVLVVDEAGQVGLGHLVGMASASRNLVLVGDPMQLPQPTKGAHPRGSGASCLEHAIGERAVVEPERGVFLGTTFRMHPALARFVSEAIYDGKLEAAPACVNRRLVLADGVHPALKPAGLAFAELDHDGCTQRSEPEAEEIARLYADLVGSRVVDGDGVERAMTSEDVLVVAPYNVQVNLLRERLAPLAGEAGPRVGTVDKFQGQEAEAVLVSMTTSDADSMPRDASFLLSRNRLNVAVSRARCLAVVVASGGLLDLDARSVEEMRLANLLCWARIDAGAACAATPAARTSRTSP